MMSYNEISLSSLIRTSYLYVFSFHPEVANFQHTYYDYLYVAVAGSADKHGTLWIAERVVAASLYGVLPAAYIMQPSFAMDTALTSVLVLHAHW